MGRLRFPDLKRAGYRRSSLYPSSLNTPHSYLVHSRARIWPEILKIIITIQGDLTYIVNSDNQPGQAIGASVTKVSRYPELWLSRTPKEYLIDTFSEFIIADEEAL